MNNLQLCEQLHLDSGLNGVAPPSTINQTGMSNRIVQWIRRAWNDIQKKHNCWKWMRKDFSFEAAVGTEFTPASAGITEFSRWAGGDRAFSCYAVSKGQSDQGYLNTISCEAWRAKYDFGTVVAPGRPADIAIDDKTGYLLIGPEPDESYTILGQYYQSAHDLAGDTDTPDCPSVYHRVIVDKALLYFSAYMSSPELYTTANGDYQEGMSDLESNQKPLMSVSPQGGLA